GHKALLAAVGGDVPEPHAQLGVGRGGREGEVEHGPAHEHEVGADRELVGGDGRVRLRGPHDAAALVAGGQGQGGGGDGVGRQAGGAGYGAGGGPRRGAGEGDVVRVQVLPPGTGDVLQRGVVPEAPRDHGPD